MVRERLTDSGRFMKTGGATWQQSKMCEYAIDALVRKIRGEMVPSKIVFPVTLEERESVRAFSQDRADGG